jgi:hypothetical protein
MCENVHLLSVLRFLPVQSEPVKTRLISELNKYIKRAIILPTEVRSKILEKGSALFQFAYRPSKNQLNDISCSIELRIKFKIREERNNSDSI